MPELISGRYEPDHSAMQKGNFGELIGCLDRKSGERVALKVALADHEGNPLLREGGEDTFASILHEASVLSALNHPNILRYIGQGYWRGRPYLAVELLEGQDLFRFQRNGGHLSAIRKADILLQSARALEAVHKAGLLHLDIKPENLFLCPDGRVLLIDFGTARKTAEARVPGLGEAVTPAYSAPEQFAQSRFTTGIVSPAADVFAFAVLTFELLSGHHPFGGHDQGVGLRIIGDHTRGDLAELESAPPAELRNLISRCFQKNPQKRHQSLPALCEQFENWLCQLREKEVRSRVSELSAAGRLVDAADAWLGHVDVNPCVEPQKSAEVLIPVVRAVIAERDPVRGLALLDSIDTDLLSGDPQARWRDLSVSLRTRTELDGTIEAEVERLWALGKEGKWKVHDFKLNQILEKDPGHPLLTSYLIESLNAYMLAADNRWEADDIAGALGDLRMLETRYVPLSGDWEKAVRSIANLKQRWQRDVLDRLLIEWRDGGSAGVLDLANRYRDLLEGDPAFAAEFAAALSEAEQSSERVRENAERRTRENAERRTREDAERTAREDAERTAREDAERTAREDTERRTREDAERRTREDAERRTREDAERRTREDAERRTREDAERRTREDAERRTREDAERRTREDAERRTREDAERRTREDAERRTREDAERRTREDAERRARKDTERATGGSRETRRGRKPVLITASGLLILTAVGYLASRGSANNHRVPDTATPVDWGRVRYDSNLLDNCAGNQECLRRKAQAELLSAYEWNSVRYDDTVLKDCMDYPTCVERRNRSKALTDIEWRKVPRNDPRRKDCMGYEPCAKSPSAAAPAEGEYDVSPIKKDRADITTYKQAPEK